ncbi:MAG TPA: hypothetical protein VEL51_04475 [Vicinamibacterales bacterium]|nr:hypothetical protein [Vicinamibacterales bacterium]
MADGILGLGGPDSTVRDIDDSNASSPSPSSEAARRRRRMSEGADELTPETTAEAPTTSGGHGATGIDMGSGGEGTDIE